MQIWPVWNVHTLIALASAFCRSASAKMMLGDLPPSSSRVRCMRRAAAAWMWQPTAVLPVNEIMSTSGDSQSATPISGDEPQTKLTTPGGRTESIMRQSSATPSGSIGAGLTTTVLPQASAGPTLPAQLVIGKLYGVMHATTPTGSRTAMPLPTPGPCRIGVSGSGSCGGTLAERRVLGEAEADRADLLRLGDEAQRAGLGDRQVDERRLLALEQLRRFA